MARRNQARENCSWKIVPKRQKIFDLSWEENRSKSLERKTAPVKLKEVGQREIFLALAEQVLVVLGQAEFKLKVSRKHCNFECEKIPKFVLANLGKTGTMVVNPGRQVPKDNSSQGSVIESPKSSTSSTIGSGRVLGGSSSGSDAQRTVREMWAKRFEDDKKKDGKSDVKENDCTICPVCQKKVAASTINQHLDECLTLRALK